MFANMFICINYYRKRELTQITLEVTDFVLVVDSLNLEFVDFVAFLLDC